MVPAIIRQLGLLCPTCCYLLWSSSKPFLCSSSDLCSHELFSGSLEHPKCSGLNSTRPFSDYKILYIHDWVVTYVFTTNKSFFLILFTKKLSKIPKLYNLPSHQPCATAGTIAVCKGSSVPVEDAPYCLDRISRAYWQIGNWVWTPGRDRNNSAWTWEGHKLTNTAPIFWY